MRLFGSVLVAICVGTITSPLHSDVVSADAPLDRAQTRTNLELQILQSDYDLTDWHRGQIERLHEKGFASWAELQKANLKTKAAYHRLDELQAAADWLKKSSAQSASSSNEEANHNAISLTNPERFRTIAWLPTNSKPTVRNEDHDTAKL